MFLTYAGSVERVRADLRHVVLLPEPCMLTAASEVALHVPSSDVDTRFLSWGGRVLLQKFGTNVPVRRCGV